MLRLLDFFSAGRRTDERYGRGAERGKEQVPVMRNAERKQVPGGRKVGGRVFGAAPGPPPETSQGGVAAHRAWRQRNASVVVRRNINHIGMVVYGVYAIGL